MEVEAEVVERSEKGGKNNILRKPIFIGIGRHQYRND